MSYIRLTKENRRRATRRVLSITLSAALAVNSLLAGMPVLNTQVASAATTVTISNVAELRSAIENQAPNQVWNIAAGNYGLSAFNDITVEGQTGWYFPITEDNITINGAGEGITTLYGTGYTANSSWHTQNFVSIFGDDVTLSNLSLMPKVEPNKTVEVLGNDATLQNVTIEPNTLTDPTEFESIADLQDRVDLKQWGGSLYFNHAGNHVVENVTIKNAGISYRYSPVGTHITLNNVNLEYTTDVDWISNYRYSSGFNEASNTITGTPNITYNVNTTLGNLGLALSSAKDGDRVSIGSGVYESALAINKSIEISGAGIDSTTIKAPSSFTNGGDLISISGAGVTVNMSDLSIDGVSNSYANKGAGIHIRDGAHANLDNLKVEHVRNEPATTKHLYAIHVGGETTTGTASITNSHISDYQRGGIYVIGGGSFATINSNTVEANPDLPGLLNGISVQYDANAEIIGNTINGNSYSGVGWAGSGISIWDNATTATIINSNTVTGNQVGLALNTTTPSVLTNLDVNGISGNESDARRETGLYDWGEPSQLYYGNITDYETDQIVMHDGKARVVGWNLLQETDNPEMAIISPANDSRVGGIQTVKANITDESDIAKVLLTVKLETGANRTYVWEEGKTNNSLTRDGNEFSVDVDTNLLAEGPNYIVLRVTDGAGATLYWNNNSAHRQHVFFVDNTAPVATITSPNDSVLLKGIVQLVGEVTDDNPMNSHFLIQGPNGYSKTSTFKDGRTTHEFNWDTTSAEDGIYSIQFEARDLANNKEMPGASVDKIQVEIDNTAPIATITTPAIDGQELNGIIVVTGEVDSTETNIKSHWFEITKPDNTKYYEYNMNTTSLSYSFNLDTSSGDGEYVIRYVATDRAGNRSDKLGSTIRTILVDNEAPALTLVNVEDGTDTSRTISGTGEPGASVHVEVHSTPQTWDGTVANDGTWSHTFSNLGLGTHSVKVTLTDAAGNTNYKEDSFRVVNPKSVNNQGGGNVLGAQDNKTTPTPTPTKGAGAVLAAVTELPGTGAATSAFAFIGALATMAGTSLTLRRRRSS